MAKRKHKVPKTGAVWHLSAEEATMLNKPQFNGHAIKSGPHGDVKYNRARDKRAWRKELQQQRASYRGPLRLHGYVTLGFYSSMNQAPLQFSMHALSCSRTLSVTHLSTLMNTMAVSRAGF